jgi:hypothetical protein
MEAMVTSAMRAYWGEQLAPADFFLQATGKAKDKSRKYKPQLPKNASDASYICFRIFDALYNAVPDAEHETNSLAARLRLECKVLRGPRGREVFSRSMQVDMNRMPAPPGSYTLFRLPALPASFLQAFDSAMRVFFSDNPPPLLRLDVLPACLYFEDSMKHQIRQLVRFSYDGQQVRVSEGPPLSWMPGALERRQTGKGVHEGRLGLLGFLITSNTGLGTSRTIIDTIPCMTTIPFRDPQDSNLILFHLPVQEITTEEVDRQRVGPKGNRTVIEQSTGSSFQRRISGTSIVMAGPDTIALFNMVRPDSSDMHDPYPYCWDGADSTTIEPMLWAANNLAGHVPLNIKGILYGKPFTISNLKAGNQLDIFYDEQHIATLRVKNNAPLDGIIYYADISRDALRVLGMFACLPYAYYGIF